MRRVCLATLAAAAVVLAVPGTAGAAARYRVQWGDTLTAIAAAHGTTLERLARMNHMDPYAVLLADSVLRVPDREPRHAKAKPQKPRQERPERHENPKPKPRTARYVVGWGDTLTGIAVAHGTTLERLAAMNHMQPYGILLSGSTLRVPAAASPPSHAAKPKAETKTKPKPKPRTLVPWTVQGALDRWAAHYGIDRHLVRGLAWMESGYRVNAISSAGARGVMQVMPGTREFVERSLIGHRVAATADGDIRVGVAYLAYLLRLFSGDERLALAGYYQGPGAVQAYGILPVSEPYVANILALRARM